VRGTCHSAHHAGGLSTCHFLRPIFYYPVSLLLRSVSHTRHLLVEKQPGELGVKPGEGDLRCGLPGRHWACVARCPREDAPWLHD
jgi:hypothetical protein